MDVFNWQVLQSPAWKRPLPTPCDSAISSAWQSLSVSLCHSVPVYRWYSVNYSQQSLKDLTERKEGRKPQHRCEVLKTVDVID
ncbi:hypothetical protein KIN20_032484 [Parelaphostrongylus tenuis]|uniref:Uncharacterized protein n=1 Tax=Parelaphostrongylus tenuis TaxID=148309 RepID=A0AAD5R8V3_PARTN|nr:hypothetical protein KIN20_032484 [Parelaphostrongylus tenuis]